ncbi:MAG: hypothetical protein ABI831_23855 [Betaproteobacteria bacterium]
MTDYIDAWQCIGCGKIEAPQPCLGVCQDRRVRLVDAIEHDAVLAGAQRAERRAQTLETLVRQLACTTPRAGAWEQSYRTMQARAQRTLTALPDDNANAGPPTPAK